MFITSKKVLPITFSSISLRWLPWWLSGKESACDAGYMGLIPGPGRSPGEGNGNPLQHSSLKNSMVREARQITVHGDAESDTTEQLTLV